MTDPLRKRIAHAIHRYDNHHALSGNDIPSKHHYGEADFVLAELRTELATADPELQRRLEAAIAALGKSETELARLRPENARLGAELGDYDQRVERLTAELAALRTVARGDAAPTAEDWERERQRADEAEGRLAHLQATSEAAGRLLTQTTDEHAQLQAAIRRVRDYAADIERGSWTGPAIARRIREALDEPAAGPAATLNEEERPS